MLAVPMFARSNDPAPDARRSRRRARAFLALAVGVCVAPLAASLPLGAACTGFTCECFFADRAVTLVVVDDATARGVDDFFVEAIVNDVPIGEPPECNARFREGNTCSFGEEPGIYHVIVRAPGYETREAVARVAEEADSDLCCNALLASKNIEIALTPDP